MVPRISGKKTWEGFFGAIVFALLCSLTLSSTTPTNSWPIVIGTGIVFWAECVPVVNVTSVPQIHVFRTRMRTSSPRTSGIGTSSSYSPGSALAFTTAFIIFCTTEN
jgi:CDP-diglyceride synthetase